MEKNFDVIIVGAGPAGLFCAYEVVTKRPLAKVAIVEVGKPIEKRVCPAAQAGRCLKCPVCAITHGSAGAGAFSDGKLLLPRPGDRFVRGNLGKHLAVNEAKELFSYTDQVYLNFGATRDVFGRNAEGFLKELQPYLAESGLRAKSSVIRHLGTDGSREVYKNLETFLMERGVTFLFDTEVTELICEENEVRGVRVRRMDSTELQELYSDTVVLAVGRAGTSWLEKMCKKYNLKHTFGSADIGVRYEVPNSVMADINEHLYEGKFIGRPQPYQDKVRTFCQNPSGLVSAESYEGGNLTLVNGHSHLSAMSENTNLALLVSLNLSGLGNPTQLAKDVTRAVNTLGNGQPVVQRLSDIRYSRETTHEVLARNSVRPTLAAAVPGDLTMAMPHRVIVDLLGFIKQMDIVIPGFADGDNLLYGPEAKFYSLMLELSKNCETSISGLYGIGDGSGPTHGLMPASVNGVFLARHLVSKF